MLNMGKITLESNELTSEEIEQASSCSSKRFVSTTLYITACILGVSAFFKMIFSFDINMAIHISDPCVSATIITAFSFPLINQGKLNGFYQWMAIDSQQIKSMIFAQRCLSAASMLSIINILVLCS